MIKAFEQFINAAILIWGGQFFLLNHDIRIDFYLNIEPVEVIKFEPHNCKFMNQRESVLLRNVWSGLGQIILNYSQSMKIKWPFLYLVHSLDLKKCNLI